MRRLRFVLTLVVTAILAGIAAVVVALTTGDDDEVTGGDGAASPTPDLTVTAEIRRSFNRSGLVVIAVTNHGAAPVTVTSAELLSDSFEAMGPQSFDSTIPPGDTPRDLQLEYGPARCPDGVDSEAVPSQVELVARVEGGAEHELMLDLPHPNGTLNRLLRTDCGAQVLQQSVSLTMGPLVPNPDGTLTAILTVTPVDAGVTPAITDTRGSVLFEVTPQPDPALPPGQLRVVADILRCGGHAIGDAKRPYGFTAWIDLGDGEQIPTAIPVDTGHRAALDAMQAQRCAGRNDES
ncbi:hypothetical protein E1262_03375 [Jiangella aurantiaca]|uniref:DUF4232 domain-containing protein n=1 Tax=Jiangella aurantiaca TaxID=2530373 RepID=A0A4R5ALH7_9ACTN|nr:hypothetical protein [Jiangella aurantiaca]TDD72359.1 hypothetical protein E1262_03375 [Jiangella aurantiaca]